MKFTKMEGAGNDYVYVDCFSETLPEPPETLAGKVSDRHFGIGGDGLVLICPSEKADARMRMFNPDGSESEMCGNAIRCVAKYVYEHDICRNIPLNIETGAGILTLVSELVDGQVVRVCVDMGKPILVPEKVPTTLRALSGDFCAPAVEVPFELDGRDLRVTCVSMGNPHCVIFVEEPTDELVLGLGPSIETDPRFPARTNVEFARVLNRGELKMRVWERGTGETMACGTGACATAVAAVLAGKTDREVTLRLRGGDLYVEWDAVTGHVMMTGPAREVFSGVWRG
ncbi:MAG: diaminopimelate epimerase [Thermoguttaceae bacterium]|jgi:diaminopimelate epimerase